MELAEVQMRAFLLKNAAVQRHFGKVDFFFLIKNFHYEEVSAYGYCLIFVSPQNDKSTNNVKVIGGDELSNLAGKVSLSVTEKYCCLLHRGLNY